MPRSRAAQAAYAMQLYDRGIIKTPGELAKVADLPDQDDLLAGIDPDTARAQRENYWLAIGTPRTVDVIDDHQNHLKLHRDFMRSERYEYLADADPAVGQAITPRRTRCTPRSRRRSRCRRWVCRRSLRCCRPRAPSRCRPTTWPSAQAMGGMVPQTAMTPAAPASPGQAMGQPGGLPPDDEAEINTLGGSPPGINPPAQVPPAAGGAVHRPVAMPPGGLTGP